MKNREPIWWIPLLRRMIVWAFITTIPWGLALMLLLFIPLFVISVWAMPQVGGEPIQERAKFLMNLLTLFGPCISGFTVGLTSGFYAPAKDSANPFCSQFYMDVAAETFVLLLLFIVVWIAAMMLLLRFVNLNPMQEVSVVVPGYFVLFGLSLWLAINLALRATKLR